MLAGVVLAALAFVKQMADAQLKAFADANDDDHRDTHPEERDILARFKNRITIFDFGGPLSFGAAADVGHQVREKARGDTTQVIVLDFSRVPFVDVSAARAVETIGCDARQAGKRVFICGMTDEVSKVLTGLDADHCLPGDTYFESRMEALHAAADYLSNMPAAQSKSTPKIAPAAT